MVHERVEWYGVSNGRTACVLMSYCTEKCVESLYKRESKRTTVKCRNVQRDEIEIARVHVQVEMSTHPNNGLLKYPQR